MSKVIETERLRLLPWKDTADEAEELYSFAKNKNVGPAANWKPHESPEESRKIIRDFYVPNNCFKIIEKSSSKVIGFIGAEGDKRRVGINSKEMGYALAEESWGNGYMTEAGRAFIDNIFDEEDLDILAICTNEDNYRSQRVISKLNFTYEGTERFASKNYDETVRDVKVYSILKKEWGNIKKHSR